MPGSGSVRAVRVDAVRPVTPVRAEVMSGSSASATALPASTAVLKPLLRSRTPALVSMLPESGRLTPRTERVARIESTTSAGAFTARAVSCGSSTAARADRSTCANGSATVHIDEASARSRSSQAWAWSEPVPALVAPPGSEGLARTR
nr:hypothetical protein [Nocardia cyriacigeorgica]